MRIFLTAICCQRAGENGKTGTPMTLCQMRRSRPVELNAVPPTAHESLQELTRSNAIPKSTLPYLLALLARTAQGTKETVASCARTISPSISGITTISETNIVKVSSHLARITDAGSTDLVVTTLKDYLSDRPLTRSGSPWIFICICARYITRPHSSAL
jgi:hypothetical protein